MKETFEDYLKAVKQRRDEDGYPYSDEDIEKHSSYFKDCWKQNLSCYKALEWLYFEINGGL
jgi:hypothetical protein